MATESIFLDRDNASHLILTEQLDPQVLSMVTRVIIKIGGVEYDSDALGNTRIWWNEQVSHKGQMVDALKFKLGDQAIPMGEYKNCRVVLFDAGNPNGVVWTDELIVIVK